MATWTNKAEPMSKGISLSPQTVVIQRFTVWTGNVTTFKKGFITLFVNQHDFGLSLSQN